MFKKPDENAPVPLQGQINKLVLLTDQISTSLSTSGKRLPKGIIEGLTQLSSSLAKINKQINTQEEEQTNLLALAEIGQLINSSLDTNEVLQIVMDTIVRLTGAERGFLMLRNKEGKLETRFARNWEQETLEDSEFAISNTIINRVVEDGKPILTTNAQEDPRFGGQESIMAHNLRSILCVPLMVKDDLIGVIYADNRVRTGLFAEKDRDLLYAFGNQAAVSLENARLFESVQTTLSEVSELKNLMENIFASIASGVITADINNKITMINKSALQILATTENDILGKSYQSSFGALATQVNNAIDQVQSSDTSITGLETSPTIKSRGKVDLRFNLSPLKDGSNNTQGVAIVLDDLTEQKKLEAQRGLFEKMVSPHVIDKLDPNALKLGGEKAYITTLFADIRGFTKFSENLSPEQLVSILNQYLGASAEAIMAEEGTIDKFMGDAVMAWYNHPIPQEDHALKAVKSAILIREGIEKLHQKLPSNAHLSFGVGIHYGEAVLGLVGTEQRIEYTAIGDSINTAKRIQENSEAGQILISQTVASKIEDEVSLKQVESIEAKGKAEPIPVFEVLKLK